MMSRELLNSIDQPVVDHPATVVPATWPSAQNIFCVDTLLSKWRFYLPDLDLANRILDMNDRLGDDYFGHVFDAAVSKDSANVIVEDPIDARDWHRWLFRQISEILFHRRTVEEKTTRLSSEESVSLFQKFLSERIYNHLAMLSRTEYVKRGNEFSIREELTDEIAEKVGLGISLHAGTDESRRYESGRLLMELAYGFQQWLVEDQQGIYRTTWGDVCIPHAKEQLLQEGVNAPLVMTPDVDKPAHALGRLFKRAARR